MKIIRKRAYDNLQIKKCGEQTRNKALLEDKFCPDDYDAILKLTESLTFFNLLIDFSSTKLYLPHSAALLQSHMAWDKLIGLSRTFGWEKVGLLSRMLVNDQAETRRQVQQRVTADGCR